MPGLSALGHHLARALLVEAIDHHPVEPGQGAHLPRALAEIGRHAVALVQPRHHGAHHGAGFDFFLGRRFGLDHHLAAGKMQRQVEQRALVPQRDIEQPLHRIGAAQQGDAVADAVDRFFGEQLQQRLADRRAGRDADELIQIDAGAGDEPIGADGQQKTERLDIAQHMNRLALAIGKVDLEGAIVAHATGVDWGNNRLNRLAGQRNPLQSAIGLRVQRLGKNRDILRQNHSRLPLLSKQYPRHLL